MGDIYRGSICTIAASSAMDSQEGFFSSRNPLLNLPCRLNDNFGIPSYRDLPPDYLSSRGWVVQERALAPRTIFYAKGAISWECVETQIEEYRVIEREDQPKIRFYSLSLIPLEEVDLSAQHLITRDDRLWMFHTHWTKLLRIYTATTLTQPSDKLVAINGIISRIEKSAQLKSLAGLWKELLPAELLWKVEDPTQMPLAALTQEYRAPSWSWASLDSPVINDLFGVGPAYSYDLKIKWMITIVEAKATSLPNGQVSAAHLYLSGPLRCVREVKSNTDGQQQKSDLRAQLWTLDNGIKDANEELWALLVAREGWSSLIITPIDGSRTRFQRRHIFSEDVDKGIKTFTFI